MPAWTGALGRLGSYSASNQSSGGTGGRTMRGTTQETPGGLAAYNWGDPVTALGGAANSPDWANMTAAYGLLGTGYDASRYDPTALAGQIYNLGSQNLQRDFTRQNAQMGTTLENAGVGRSGAGYSAGGAMANLQNDQASALARLADQAALQAVGITDQRYNDQLGQARAFQGLQAGIEQGNVGLANQQQMTALQGQQIGAANDAQNANFWAALGQGALGSVGNLLGGGMLSGLVPAINGQNPNAAGGSNSGGSSAGSLASLLAMFA